MFTGELAESRATEVTIRDVDEQAMEQLVEFCYTAHIVVEESNVQVRIQLPTDLYMNENGNDREMFSRELKIGIITLLCFNLVYKLSVYQLSFRSFQYYVKGGKNPHMTLN